MIYEKEGKILSLEEFQKETCAKWVDSIEFDPAIFPKIQKKIAKLEKRKEISIEQKWLGAYFLKEILFPPEPKVAIRWIDASIGWGVFATENIPSYQFIAEYSGFVRKWARQDKKNSYCFCYQLTECASSSYVIDARDKGGVARYINHGASPNLSTTLITIHGINRIILYTKRAVAKGEQLCYDYGPTYWAKRNKPQAL